MTVQRPGRPDAVYDRALRPTLAPEALTRLSGRYSSDELAQSYTLSVSSGRLLLRLDSRPLFGRFLDPVAPGLFEGSGVFLRVHERPGGEPELELHIPPYLSIMLTRTPPPAA